MPPASSFTLHPVLGDCTPIPLQEFRNGQIPGACWLTLIPPVLLTNNFPDGEGCTVPLFSKHFIHLKVQVLCGSKACLACVSYHLTGVHHALLDYNTREMAIDDLKKAPAQNCCEQELFGRSHVVA